MSIAVIHKIYGFYTPHLFLENLQKIDVAALPMALKSLRVQMFQECWLTDVRTCSRKEEIKEK